MVLTYVFFVLAILAVVFSVAAIVHRNPVVNVLSLVVVFFALAGLYAVMGMDFLAAIQLIVYSGAVLVLFLFVVMLLNISRVERFGSGRRIQAVLGTIAALGFAVLIVYGLAQLRPEPGAVMQQVVEQGSVPFLGRELLTTYLFSFELISVLLLAALVGAFVLARRDA